MRLVHNFPAVVLHPVTIPGCSVVPNNFHLFVSIKKYLCGKQFAIKTDLKQAVTCWLQALGTDFCCNGIQTFVPWYKYISVVPTGRSGVYHLLHVFTQYSEVRTNFSAAECLLLYFSKLPYNIQYPTMHTPHCTFTPSPPSPPHTHTHDTQTHTPMYMCYGVYVSTTDIFSKQSQTPNSGQQFLTAKHGHVMIYCTGSETVTDPLKWAE